MRLFSFSLFLVGQLFANSYLVAGDASRAVAAKIAEILADSKKNFNSVNHTLSSTKSVINPVVKKDLRRSTTVLGGVR